MKKILAFFYLMAIALVPVVIVALYGFDGGIWVAGYLIGMITVPLVFFGAVRAVSEITEDGAFLGSFVFGFVVVLLSVASAVWAFVAA